MSDDIVLNKVASIDRCVARVREETASDLDVLDDQTVQDAVVLNLQRACETSVDLAMHLVATRRLGVPQESRNAFEPLRDAGVIDPDLTERLRRMVGFRTIAVHEYRRLSREILESIIRERLDDFAEFARSALRAC
jgi:uncharacterized protein YutE (UPF0331/DUF86 family)